MKSLTYPSLAAAIVCLLMASVAFAQQDTPIDAEANAAVRADLQADRTAARADIEAERAAAVETREAAMSERTTTQADARASSSAARADMQQERAERRAELNDRTKERITNLAANISNRMDAAAARMQNIITRLESRIDKLQSAGLNTTEATVALASAQTSIDAAVIALTRIDVTVQTAVTAEDPRAAWEEVKVAYGSIRAQLRTANTEMRASVQALKDAARATDGERGSAAAVQSNTQTSADQDVVSITSESEATAE